MDGGELGGSLAYRYQAIPIPHCRIYCIVSHSRKYTYIIYVTVRIVHTQARVRGTNAVDLLQSMAREHAAYICSTDQ